MTKHIIDSDYELYAELAMRLEYTADGKLLWVIATRSDRIGEEAGATDLLGYRRIRAQCGRLLAAHKLVYFIHTGELPQVIDHRDGDVSNNRIENLRAATISQNAMNCKVSTSNTSGIKGVSMHKATGKWVAYIRKNGDQKSLGLFTHIFEAACARRSAELAYYGEFVR